MIMKLIKEVCEPCSRPINIGHPILECEACHTAIHTRCYKLAGFCPANNLWVCKTCSFKITPRYNPFEELISSDSDKFYDNEYAGEEEAFIQISDTLNKCQSYKTCELNKVISASKPTLGSSKNSSHITQFSTYFMNIDGNTTNFDSLLVELERITHNFSVIALAETNTDQPLQELYQIPGYNSFYQCTMKDKTKGTGVALYVANYLNAEIIENLGGCLPDIESLFVRITLPNDSHSLTCGVVYRPPNGNFQTFLKEYNHLNTLLPRSGVRLIGDFNVDLLKVKSNSASNGTPNQFEEAFIKAGLTPVISIPTHRRASCKPSCIDNIFTSDPQRVILSGTIEDHTGDHLPIFEITDISVDSNLKHEKHVKYYEFSNKNLEKFVLQLDNDLKCINTPDVFSQFTEIFHCALDSTCKLEKPKVTKRTPQNNPWITDSIKAAVEKKHELKNNWVKSIDKKLNPEGDQHLHKIFTDYRRVLKAVINAAKSTHNCNRISESKHDRKKTWQIINELRGKSKKALKPSIVIDNKKITERRVIANEFNKYFNSIAAKLNESITSLSDSNFSSFEEFLMPSNESSIFLDDCSVTELLDIIKQFDNNKSSDIPIRVIKKSAHIICPYLCVYFNLFMATGHFPDVLKVGKVTPIFKKGNLEEIGNYRPVSTLPIFGKIFEKVIYSRIYNFALSQNIIDKNQFGFRKCHSTSHAVNYSVKIIEDSMIKQNHVLGIFIDLSKAFDTIDHGNLLIKLDRYGIRGNANTLIRSYLSDRIQYTEIHNEKSDTLTISYGVPQGSVLGPLLFLLYINDISNCSDLGTFVLFADDTNIFVEGKSAEEAYRKGNALLRLVREYMVLNKLHINMTKCCYIHFKPKSSQPPDLALNLKIEDFPIKRVDSAKFLGVIIDDQLSWEPHVTALRRKLSYASATLCRIRDSVPVELHCDLYHTLFESHLTYCISVWGGTSNNISVKVWTAQKHCIRVLFGDKQAYLDKSKTCAKTRPYGSQTLGSDFFELEHTKPLFKKHRIMAVENLYTYHTFMEAFKILKLRCPASLYHHFHKSPRKETSLIVPPVTTNGFISRSTTIWNSIAPKLKLQDFSYKISLAKSNLKKALLNIQDMGDPISWTENDFDFCKIYSAMFDKKKMRPTQ